MLYPLYDPGPLLLPSQQGWLEFGRGFAGTQTLTNHGTTLDTTLLTADIAGYSNYKVTTTDLVNNAFPNLNRTVGFALDIRLRIIDQNHDASNRAGFSLTLLDQGATPRGIELGFAGDRIFSQGGGSTAFETIGEQVEGIDTSQTATYSLRIIDDHYYLLANNRLALSGAVQDYSQWPKNPLLPYNPYTTPNFLFLGDNTSRGSAKVELGSISLALASRGTNRADQLKGTNSADIMNGQAGDDELRGLAGNDWLIGGRGRDLLEGGPGNDLLIGGSQADRFVFRSGKTFNTQKLGVDTIADFSPAEDRIRLARSSFSALPAGSTLATSAFASVNSLRAAALNRAAIVYNRSTGSLYYNPNGRAPGFAASERAGGEFAVLWGGSSTAPGPAIDATVFEIS